MIFSPPPCSQDCPKRSPKCHFKDNCPEHDVWKAEENRRNVELNKQKAVIGGLVENTTASYIKHVVKANSRRMRGVKTW